MVEVNDGTVYDRPSGDPCGATDPSQVLGLIVGGLTFYRKTATLDRESDPVGWALSVRQAPLSFRLDNCLINPR